MMRKALGFVLAGMVLAFCGTHLPVIGPGFVLYAAQVPYSAVFSWDANPATDNVVSYVTSLDTGPQQTQPITVCTAGRCKVTVVIASFGQHSVGVAGQNLNLTTQVQTGAFSSLSFPLNPDPGAPKNLGIGPPGS